MKVSYHFMYDHSAHSNLRTPDWHANVFFTTPTLYRVKALFVLSDEMHENNILSYTDIPIYQICVLSNVPEYELARMRPRLTIRK
jgi:hypothetical protein